MTSARSGSPTSADLLVDTSVAVPLVLSDLAAHDSVRTAVGDRILGLAGHACFETFSVLTRLPAPHRLAPRTVQQLLTAAFPATHLLSAGGGSAAIVRMAELGLGGGAVYDALVAAAAAEAGLPLLTRDRRAEPTYRAFGVDARLVSA